MMQEKLPTKAVAFILDLQAYSETSVGPNLIIYNSARLLSCQNHFHPDEVAFILIDYKGGGLTGAFESDNFRRYHRLCQLLQEFSVLKQDYSPSTALLYLNALFC